MGKLTKEQLETMGIVRNIRKNVMNKNWGCMCDGCTDKAINSHLLQRHGVLDNIMEDNHMVEMRPKDIFKWNENEVPMTFKKVGLNEAISYPLFCNHHDTELFLEIESTNPDVNAYHSQLLFTYRCVCAEIRKKEIEIEFNKRQLNAESLNFDSSLLKDIIKGLECGINDLKSYAEMLLDEIKSPKHNFVFHVVKLPFIPIYASATFSFETNYKKLKSELEIWDGAFMHIIPRVADTYIILGTHKSHMNDELDKFISRFSCANKDSIGILLTDMFSQRIENFGMSISLFESLGEGNINKFFEFQKQSMLVYDMALEPDFNLFEGEYWDSLWKKQIC